MTSKCKKCKEELEECSNIDDKCKNEICTMCDKYQYIEECLICDYCWGKIACSDCWELLVNCKDCSTQYCKHCDCDSDEYCEDCMSIGCNYHSIVNDDYFYCETTIIDKNSNTECLKCNMHYCHSHISINGICHTCVISEYDILVKTVGKVFIVPLLETHIGAKVLAELVVSYM